MTLRPSTSFLAVILLAIAVLQSGCAASKPAPKPAPPDCEATCRAMTSSCKASCAKIVDPNNQRRGSGDTCELLCQTQQDACDAKCAQRPHPAAP